MSARARTLVIAAAAALLLFACGGSNHDDPDLETSGTPVPSEVRSWEGATFSTCEPWLRGMAAPTEPCAT